MINLEYKVVIPDNNAVDDYTLIQMSSGSHSYIGNVDGRHVCSIAENISFSTRGLLKWERVDDKGELVNIGILPLLDKTI